MCQSCCGWGQEAELKSHGRAGGRKSDSWKGSFSPFVPQNMALFPLLLFVEPSLLAAVVLSPPLYPPVYTLSIYLFLPLGPAFLLLLCPSLSACLPPPPPPLFPLPSLSPHDINRKGRLCSPREIYCSFKKKPFMVFPLFLSMGLSTRPLFHQIRAISRWLSVHVRARVCPSDAASGALLNSPEQIHSSALT